MQNGQRYFCLHLPSNVCIKTATPVVIVVIVALFCALVEDGTSVSRWFTLLRAPDYSQVVLARCFSVAAVNVWWSLFILLTPACRSHFSFCQDTMEHSCSAHCSPHNAFSWSRQVSRVSASVSAYRCVLPPALSKQHQVSLAPRSSKTPSASNNSNNQQLLAASYTHPKLDTGRAWHGLHYGFEPLLVACKRRVCTQTAFPALYHDCDMNVKISKRPIRSSIILTSTCHCSTQNT